MQTNPETKKSNRTLLYVLGGCAVLFLCVACLGISIFIFRDQILSVAGMSQSQPTLPAPTSAPFAPGAASPIAPGVVPTRGNAPTTGGSNPLTDWINKAKTAQKYRCEVSWVFGSTKNGKYVEEPFLDMAGVVDGQNEQFTMKAGIFTMFTGGTPLETVEVDGKSYWKGVNMFGTTDPKVWYLQKDSSSSSGFTDFCKSDEWNSFTGSSSDFKKVRTEQLDAQSCDVYFYDLKSGQNAALGGLFGMAQNQGSFSAIDKGEINLWACSDGFVHKYTLEYAGHDQKNAADKGGMRMNWHAYDFNNPTIKVTAPTGAKPMPGQ